MSCAAVVMSTAGVQALEMSEIKMPLTRSYADRNFSKDYDFRVLEDSTVRRTWQSGNKSIIIDFDIRTDKPVCIFVDYDSAAAKMEALADVKILTEGNRDGVAWTRIKSGSTSKIGIGDCRLMRLNDGAMLFWEGGTDECERLCWFAQRPNKDRMKLSNATETQGHTAMGKAAGSGAFKQLWDDERRRQKIEVAGKPRKPVAQPEPKHTPSAVPRPAPAPAPETDDIFADETETVVIKNNKNNLLEVIGLDVNSETTKWILLGAGFVILIIIMNVVSASRRKARQQAAFEALLQQRPPRQRRRK